MYFINSIAILYEAMGHKQPVSDIRHETHTLIEVFITQYLRLNCH